MLFCNQPITDLEDLRGLKVRVASPSLAHVIEVLKGTAVTLPFEQTEQALLQGLVDCAITSAASADFDNWGSYTTHYYPLVFQFGFNGYVISNQKWNSLSPGQQRRLRKAFEAQIDSMWAYSERRQQEAEACLTRGPCRSHPPRQQQPVPVQPVGMRRLEAISRQVALPRWQDRCDRVHTGCSHDWATTVGPLTALGSVRSSR